MSPESEDSGSANVSAPFVDQSVGADGRGVAHGSDLEPVLLVALGERPHSARVWRTGHSNGCNYLARGDIECEQNGKRPADIDAHDHISRIGHLPIPLGHIFA